MLIHLGIRSYFGLQIGESWAHEVTSAGSEMVHNCKVPNPFTSEDRQLFSFSDPSHLMTSDPPHLRYTRVYLCISVYTSVYRYILVYTSVYRMYPCILVYTCVCLCIVVYTCVFLCIPLYICV